MPRPVFRGVGGVASARVALADREPSRGARPFRRSLQCAGTGTRAPSEGIRLEDEDAFTPESLTAALPRALQASGRAEAIAADWAERRAASVAAGGPAWPCFPLTADVQAALYLARKGGQLVRGLEAAELALAREARGLAATPAARVEAGGRRVSRLLLTSGDGSARFVRSVERLRRAHAGRLEVVGLDASEGELGAAAFGGDQRARALLVERREAVVRLLEALCPDGAQDESGAVGRAPAGRGD